MDWGKVFPVIWTMKSAFCAILCHIYVLHCYNQPETLCPLCPQPWQWTVSLHTVWVVLQSQLKVTVSTLSLLYVAITPSNQAKISSPHKVPLCFTIEILIISLWKKGAVWTEDYFHNCTKALFDHHWTHLFRVQNMGRTATDTGESAHGIHTHLFGVPTTFTDTCNKGSMTLNQVSIVHFFLNHPVQQHSWLFYIPQAILFIIITPQTNLLWLCLMHLKW